MSGSALVQALSRGLRLLECAAASEDGATLRQLSGALGVKPSTAHNLARTLLARGYLSKRASPVRFAIGPAVDALVANRDSQRWLNLAADAVRQLSAALPAATVVLAEWRSGEMAVRLRMHPTHPDLLEQPAASRLAPYTSACALCFQAFAPPPEVAALRQRHPYGEAEGGRWSSLDSLDRFLAAARTSGALEFHDARLRRVAAPVWGAPGRLVAVLGASMATSPTDQAASSSADAGALRERICASARCLSERVQACCRTEDAPSPTNAVAR